MREKKLLSVILAAVLLVSLFAACGSAAAAEETASAEAVSVAAEPSASVQMDAEAPAEEAAAPEISAETPVEEAASVAEAPASAQEVSMEETPEDTAEVDPETFFQDYYDEPAAADLYAEVAEGYSLLEYSDPDTGLTVPYYLFTPEKAADEACPMVMFIGDATCTGSNTEYSLSQGYGGIIWAAESEQAKRPCFVLVPVFPEVVIDDNNGETVSDYVDVAARLVQAVADEQNVDQDRIYATGQSMGCMTSLYLASHYPDLFAAELFVSGQWNIEELQGLETQTFFYVAAGGDPKASQGQADVMADLDSKGVTYAAAYDWDANLGDADLEEPLRAIIAEDSAINFGQFAAGTVTEANPRGMEHMSSFDCAYKLDVLRAWLFAQSK